jgi:hypothetical protein
MTITSSQLGELLASRVTEALVDLAALARRASWAPYEHLDGVANDLLACLLALCKAERGAVLVYEDTDAPAQSPEMTCWLVYRLPMGERSDGGDGRADDAHSRPEMLPDTRCDVADQAQHVLLVMGWENQHDPKRACASLIPQCAVLLPLVANAATLLRHEHLAREERHQFLLAMNEASDRLEVIIERLLEVSQLETGRVTLERSPVDMAHLAGESIAVIEEQVTASWPGGFVFSLQLENADGTPGHAIPLILADPRIYATKYVRDMRLRYRPGDSCRAP